MFSKGVVSLATKDLQSQAGIRVEEVLSSARQSLQWPMRREISVAWGSTLVCEAQLSQQWPVACLSCVLKVVYSTLLGLFIIVLAFLMTSGEFLWSHSADMAVLVMCADMLGMSSCQMCLA